jgi:RimJ/RimL family protein N-acetyltransferase
VLLDQNLVNDFASRYDELVPEHCARLLGPEFAMLQPEYAELHPRTPPRIGPVSRILIYFGGADVNNLTGVTLEALSDPVFADLDMDVVINPRSPHYAEICDKARNRTNIHIHESLPSLARLIMEADLAIGAGGATSWERCCLGLPAIVVTLADNQVAIASELSKQDLVTWLGDQAGITVELIRRAIQCEIEYSERLHQQSVACKKLVDGKGVNRVADRVMLNSQTQLVARLATLDDEELLLNWANDSLVRRHSFHPQAIDPVTHRNWFFKRLRNIDRCALYIVQTENGMPLGQVRFEKCENAWEIHYGLASYARGRGLGKPILREALQTFQTTISNTIFFGRVKHDNVPSRRIFESLGFTEKAGAAGELVFQKRFCSDGTTSELCFFL